MESNVVELMLPVEEVVEVLLFPVVIDHCTEIVQQRERVGDMEFGKIKGVVRIDPFLAIGVE